MSIRFQIEGHRLSDMDKAALQAAAALLEDDGEIGLTRLGVEAVETFNVETFAGEIVATSLRWRCYYEVQVTFS